MATRGSKIIRAEHCYGYVKSSCTGSRATGKELPGHCDGGHILRKPTTAEGFPRIATDDEERSFSLAGNQNPLDDPLRRCLEPLTNHSRWLTDPTRCWHCIGSPSSLRCPESGPNARDKRLTDAPSATTPTAGELTGSSVTAPTSLRASSSSAAPRTIASPSSPAAISIL